MEELQTRHRKEQRDLQSRVTQKKKQASKKTRKAVNEECERLEVDLRERQEREKKELGGEEVGDGEEELTTEQLQELTLRVDDEGEHEGQKGNGVDTGDDAPATAGGEGSTPGTGGGKKRSRQKDRLARRAAEQEVLARQAAEETANLPDMKEQERQRMLEAMKSHSLVEKVIRADGHCLYSAFADQLDQLGILLDPSSSSSSPNAQPTILPYKTVRSKAADYILEHQDDFVPFLEEPLAEYVHKVRETGEWGGQLELLALAKTYGTNIHVLQDFGRVEKIEGAGAGEEGAEGKTVWLGYYKHGFGLGEHYNSLRRAG